MIAFARCHDKQIHDRRTDGQRNQEQHVFVTCACDQLLHHLCSKHHEQLAITQCSERRADCLKSWTGLMHPGYSSKLSSLKYRQSRGFNFLESLFRWLRNLLEWIKSMYLVLVDDVRVDKEYIYFRARKIFKWSNTNVK